MVSPASPANTANTSAVDARLIAAAQDILRLQLDTNLRNVDRDALNRALGALREALELRLQPAEVEVKRKRSVDSVWTNLSGK